MVANNKRDGEGWCVGTAGDTPPQSPQPRVYAQRRDSSKGEVPSTVLSRLCSAGCALLARQANPAVVVPRLYQLLGLLTVLWLVTVHTTRAIRAHGFRFHGVASQSTREQVPLRCNLALPMANFSAGMSAARHMQRAAHASQLSCLSAPICWPHL